MESQVQSAIDTLEGMVALSEKLSKSERRQILGAVRKLALSLETPGEVAIRQVWESHNYTFAIRVAVDLGIFHKLVAKQGVPISAAELAEECKAEELLIVRIMRVLTAIDYAHEAGVSLYTATPLTEAMVAPHVEAFAIHSVDHANRVTNRLPTYFKLHGYKSPTDGENGPFQYALDTDLSFFDHLHQDPARAKIFNICMQGSKINRRFWFEWYPFVERLLALFEASKTPDSVFLVDMGGGNGVHLMALARNFPSLENHLVLQDLPGTIAGLETNKTLSPGIRPMAHDIFSPQSVPGAFTYYSHFVLHDFSDEKCRVLLKEVAKVMRPGYSRILLNETVIPETGCPAFFAASDMVMMAVLAGIVRSQSQWVRLVESAGLRVTQVWVSPDEGDMEGIIEAEVPV